MKRHLTTENNINLITISIFKGKSYLFIYLSIHSFNSFASSIFFLFTGARHQRQDLYINRVSTSSLDSTKNLAGKDEVIDREIEIHREIERETERERDRDRDRGSIGKNLYRIFRPTSQYFYEIIYGHTENSNRY